MNYVVYSADFGGFNLSRELLKWLYDHESEYVEMDKEEKTFSLKYDIPRHDPLLVEGVKTFLAEGRRPGGDSCMVDIEEIEGNKYIIEEYDGREFVTTPDEIDWIHIP